MIEAVYKIGELQEKQDFLEEFIENPENQIKQVPFVNIWLCNFKF